MIPNLSNLECKRLTSRQNKIIFYFHFDIFVFENKVTGDKKQLDRQFTLFPAAVECPACTHQFFFVWDVSEFTI